MSEDRGRTPDGRRGIPTWDNLILLGKITRTQGHRGGLRMVPEFEPVDSFEDLKDDELILRMPTPVAGMAQTPVIVHYTDFSFHQQCVILTLAEAPDMTAAERYRGAQVYVRPENVWDLPEGDFFAHEVVGFEIADAESGRRMGQVRKIEAGAGHDFLIVKRDGGPGEFLIPLVKTMVRNVDMEARRINVSLPEGLEDL